MSEDFGKSRVLATSQLSACCKMGERMKTLPVCKLWTSPEKQAFSLMLLVLRGFHRKSILFQLKSLLIDRLRKDREIDEESTSGWVLGCGAWDGNLKQLLIINWEFGCSLYFGKRLKKISNFDWLFFWLLFLSKHYQQCTAWKHLITKSSVFNAESPEFSIQNSKLKPLLRNVVFKTRCNLLTVLRFWSVVFVLLLLPIDINYPADHQRHPIKTPTLTQTAVSTSSERDRRKLPSVWPSIQLSKAATTA